MRRVILACAVVMSLLQGAIFAGAPPQENVTEFGAEYILRYSAYELQGDVASGSLTFTPNWVFRIQNPNFPVSDPRVTVTTALFPNATQDSFYGASMSQDPVGHAYIWTLPALSAVSETLQGDLKSTVTRTQNLGYTLARSVDDQRIEAGATVTRTFTLTLALAEAAREFRGGLGASDSGPGPIKVLSGFESCSSLAGTVVLDSNWDWHGVAWSAVNDSGFAAGTVFTLTCPLTLQNTGQTAAYFMPLTQMEVGKVLTNYGVQPESSFTIPSGDVNPPNDPLGGSALFEATGPEGASMSVWPSKRFFRYVSLAAVNLAEAPNAVPSWSAGYDMFYGGVLIDDDQFLDQPYPFTYGWNFNLFNSSTVPLSNPKITATWPSTIAGMNGGPTAPGEPPLTSSPAVWSAATLAPQGTPGGNVSGWLSTSQLIPSPYMLGYEVRREIAEGRDVPVGAVGLERHFTVTFTSHDATLSHIAASIDLSGGFGNPTPGPVSTSDVSCGPAAPGQWLSRNDSMAGYFWKVGEAPDPAPTRDVAYTLTCTYKVTNSSSFPAVFAPGVYVTGRRLAAPTTGTGPRSYTAPGEGANPPDPLGTVTFEAGASTVQSSLAIGFNRSVILNNVNTIVDTIPPVTAWTLPQSTTGWYPMSEVWVNLNANDPQPGSGVKQITYLLDGPQGSEGPIIVTAPWTSFKITAPGTTTITVFATDNAGNAESPRTFTVSIDGTAPTTTAVAASGTFNGWNRTPVTVTLHAIDEPGGSGVKHVSYQLANGPSEIPPPWTVVSGDTVTIAITAPGRTTINFNAQDNANNGEMTNSVNVDIDAAAPVFTPPWTAQDLNTLTVYLSANDSAVPNVWSSGVKQIWYSLSGASTTNGFVSVAGGWATVMIPNEGKTNVEYYAEDYAGNTSVHATFVATYDKTPPTTTATVSPAPNDRGWNKGTPVTVTLHATDPGGSGVKQIRYWLQYLHLGSPPPPPTSTEPMTVAGDTATITGFDPTLFTTVLYSAEDSAGNQGPWESVTVRIDTTPPSTTVTTQPPPMSIGGQSWWNVNSVTVMLNASDPCTPIIPCSGSARIWYKLDGDQTSTFTSVDVPMNGNPSVPVSVSASGTTRITYYAEDYAGNVETEKSFTVNIDRTAPMTTAVKSPDANGQGWNNGQVTVTLSATDAGSGVRNIRYQLAGQMYPTQPWIDVPSGTATVTVTAQGRTNVNFNAYDNAGNVQPGTVVVDIDTAAPVFNPPPSTTRQGNTMTVNLSAGDSFGVFSSGVKQIKYSLTGDNTTSGFVTVGGSSAGIVLTAEGTTNVAYYAEDNAGNVGVTATFVAVFDKGFPVLTAVKSPAPLYNDWNTTRPVTVIVSATDANSGVRRVGYALQPAGAAEGPWTYVTGGTITTEGITAEGTTKVFYYAEDNAGNKTSRSLVVKIDTAPPTTTASTLVPSMLVNGQSWWNADVTVRLNSVDPQTGDSSSGVGKISYKLDGAQTAPLTPLTPQNATVLITSEGTTTVTYFARDYAGNTEVEKTFVVNLDKAPPVLTLPGNLSLEAAGPGGAVVTFSATAIDAASGSVPVTCTPPPGSTFPLGQTTVNCSAKDAMNNTANGSFTVTVKDSTAPVIGTLVANPGQLWPPNHKMVAIALGVTASDAVTFSPTCRIVSVAANEPVNGAGDGNTSADWTFSGMNLSLRAERAGTLTDRIYTVAVQCKDAAGNDSVPKTVALVVPHDMAKK